MSSIFVAKTHEGYCLKIMTELLQYNIKTAYYEVDQNGLRLRMADSKQHVEFDIFLPRDNFLMFELNTDKLCFGVNQLYMHTMLRSIKKKDTVTLFISQDDPYQLGIKIEPKEKTKISSSYIKIHQAHNIVVDSLQKNYSHSIVVNASDYAKTCKELAKLSKTLSVRSGKKGIQFMASTSNIYSKDVTFGELDAAESTVSQEFTSEYLSNITKLSGMTQILHIKQNTGLPIVFCGNVGSLGKILISIKSNESLNTASENDEEHILEI